MKQQIQHEKSGFTIIEVVLVLAIAALIFLIVFLAVPALQRNQRDTQRKSDMSRMLSQLQSYSSNHAGNYPPSGNFGSWASSSYGSGTFVQTYLNSNGSNFADPSSDHYTVGYHGSVPPTVTGAVGTIDYYIQATCKDGSLTTASGNRSIALTTQLEANSDLYCLSN